MSLPVVNVDITEQEVQAVVEVVKSRFLVEGKNAKEFETKFSEFTGSKYVTTVVNGTQALHLALSSLEIGPKDEVITTPFTFVASSNSILFTGAVPIFVDVDKETYNLDPEKIEEAITPNTKAIMPVHIFGNPCDMKAIKDIAEDHNLHIIEDCAQAHDSRIEGKHVGNFGDVACYSFYGTKNLVGGEGGAVTTNNEELFETIKSLKNHGRSPQGGYNHYRIGYNYRMTDMQAAVMNVQMDRAKVILERRHKNGALYREYLKDVDGLTYQKILPDHQHSDYIFAPVITNEKITVNQMVEYLKSKNISSRPIYHVLSYQQPCYQDFTHWPLARVIDYPDYSSVKCLNAEYIASRHLEVPMVSSLKDEDITYVADTIKDFLKN